MYEEELRAAKDMKAVLSTEEKYPEYIDMMMDERLCRHTQWAMKNKLSLKREQGYGGWWNEEVCTIDDLKQLLASHIDKGDMIDVMNFAGMIYMRQLMEKETD